MWSLGKQQQKFSEACSMQYLEQTYAKKLLAFYLKFKFNWKAYLLPGNPDQGPRLSSIFSNWCT